MKFLSGFFVLALEVSLLVLAAGCATAVRDGTMALQTAGVKGDPLDPPGLAAAVSTVWTSYGRTDPSPQVLLVTAPNLTCTDPSTLNPGFTVLLASGPGCREGFTLLPFEISVAYRGQPWSQSALAHELMHVVLIRTGRGSPLGDPTHSLPEWTTLVPEAVADLTAAGL